MAPRPRSGEGREASSSLRRISHATRGKPPKSAPAMRPGVEGATSAGDAGETPTTPDEEEAEDALARITAPGRRGTRETTREGRRARSGPSGAVADDGSEDARATADIDARGRNGALETPPAVVPRRGAGPQPRHLGRDDERVRQLQRGSPRTPFLPVVARRGRHSSVGGRVEAGRWRRLSARGEGGVSGDTPPAPPPVAMMYETPEFPRETARELRAPPKSRGEATVPTGVGPGGHNPLFEPSPDDSGYGVGSSASGGGIGIARRDVPEAHLRKVRAGGLLTKLPFSAPTAKPRIRFFRVTRAMTELQWGDPKDAAAPALDSKLPLHEVHTVVHGHATRTFEKHRKRVGPPSHCFSLVSHGRTLDLVAGTADDANLWSAALDVLAGRAREARAIADADAAARSAGNAVVSVSPSRDGSDPNPSRVASSASTAVRPGLLARPRAPVPTDAPGFSPSFSPSGGIGNASSTPTPDAPERRRAGGFGFGAFGGSKSGTTDAGRKSGTTDAGTVASRAAPAVFTPAPAGSLSRQNSLEAERRERLSRPSGGRPGARRGRCSSSPWRRARPSRRRRDTWRYRSTIPG